MLERIRTDARFKNYTVFFTTNAKPIILLSLSAYMKGTADFNRFFKRIGRFRLIRVATCREVIKIKQQTMRGYQ